MILGSVFKNYKILSQLRPGAQGSVYIVEDIKSKLKYAMKMIFVDESSQKEIEEMIKNWKNLCSSKDGYYFVEYKEHFYERTNCFIVMELCEKGDLETLIKTNLKEGKIFTEEEVLQVLFEGMKGLKMMHFLRCIHRDIKAANILIAADGKYKLCDFGTSRSLGLSNVGKTLVGTPEYSAPEVVNLEEYSYPVDIFSLGAVLYQMITGRTPFVTERGLVLKDLMVGKYVPIPSSLGYSAPLAGIVHSCLALDPTARPSAAEILSNPFVIRAQDAADEKAHFTALEERMRRAEERLVAAERRAEVAMKETQEARKGADAARKEAVEARKEAVEAKEEAEISRKEVREARKEAREAKREAEAARKEAQETGRLLLRVMGEVEELKKSNPPTPVIADSPARSVTLPIRFVPEAVKRTVTTVVGGKIMWKTDKRDWCILDEEMRTGTYSVSVDFKSGDGDIFFGLISKPLLKADRSKPLYDTSGQCCIGCGGSWENSDYICGSDSTEYYEGVLFPTSEKVNLRLEVDMASHAVYFFVNGKQIPHCVVGLPQSVFFTIYSNLLNMVVSVTSFEKLAAPTVDKTVQCAVYRWKD